MIFIYYQMQKDRYMPPVRQAFLNWSGGKDAAFSLHKLRQQPETMYIRSLLTTLSETHRRISMHGVRESLLDEQACCLGLPLKKIYLPEDTTMPVYDELMGRQVQQFAEEGITHAVFGDIFLEDLRAYREKQLAQRGLKAVFPLWKNHSRELLLDFIDSGFRAVIVCVNAHYLDPAFAGRLIDRNFLDDLPGNVDPCGENGEYHSFVFDGPGFARPVLFRQGELAERHYRPKGQSREDECFQRDQKDWDTHFYFRDLLPDFEEDIKKEDGA